MAWQSHASRRGHSLARPGAARRARGGSEPASDSWPRRSRYVQAVGFLDPVVRRRIAAAVLIVGAVVAGMAIANVGPFSNPPTDADRARAALESFFANARRKDYGAVCKTLTSSERSQIEIRAAALAGNRTGCSKVLQSPLGVALGRVRLEIEDVRVSGNLAAIDARLRTPGAKGPEFRTYKLERLGNRWLISDVSF